MEPYSIALALALALGGGAFVLALLERVLERSVERPAALRRRHWALLAGLAGLGLTALAGVSHWMAGHRARTETALDFTAFLEAHSALFVAAALAAAGIAVNSARR